VQECDRQTDRATEKCVAIGGITCTARATSSNNIYINYTVSQKTDPCDIFGTKNHHLIVIY